MKDSYDGSCESTLPTIMKCGRINRWKECAAGSRSRAASKGQGHFSAAGWRIASSLFAGSVRVIGHTVAGRSYRFNNRSALEEQLPALTIWGAKSTGTLTERGREL
jgi:hypothetical protein